MNKDRNRRIIRCNLIGIGMNLVLSVIKITAGTLSHAHALIADGVNSLSDMTASTISIISATLAGKRGNRKNPFGYGRVEYLSSLVITMIILCIGISAIIRSVDAVLHPHEPPAYNTVTMAVVLISVVSKLLYGILMRKRGTELKSTAVFMSGLDSLGDALISAGILIAIIVYQATGVDIEHYVCIAISLLILRTGIRMLHERVCDSLQQPRERSFPDKIQYFQKDLTNQLFGIILLVRKLVVRNISRSWCAEWKEERWDMKA